MALIKIFNDVFDICQRIKEIDSNYYVVYNTIKNCYEIHNSRQYFSTFCISCPEGLNAKVVDKLRKTRIENLNKVLKEMEEENLKKENDAKKLIKDEANVKAREMFDYAKNKEFDIDFSNSYVTKWS